MAVIRYVWAVFGTSGHILGKAPGSQLTVSFKSDHEGFKRCGLNWYTDDSELVVRIQSRALEAFVVDRKYCKLKLY